MKTSTWVITFLTVLAIVSLTVAFIGHGKPLFAPGKISEAHERFGADCQACHKNEDSCLDCHLGALSTSAHLYKSAIKKPLPKHATKPVIKGCRACHREHRPAKSGLYTGPPDFCVGCHPAEVLPKDHSEYGQKSCATIKCHAYHSTFATKAHEAVYDLRLRKKSITITPRKKVKAEKKEKTDRARKSLGALDKSIVARFLSSTHHDFNVSCGKCHIDSKGKIVKKPAAKVCASCHKNETGSFFESAHGASEASSLPDYLAPENRVTCAACHDVHSENLERSSIDVCLECHKDKHSLNYKKSGHYRYRTDPVFEISTVTGPTCADCHMPKSKKFAGATDHNEQRTLILKEKMAEEVCSRCHGLGFSLISLADKSSVESNFTFSPIKQVEHAGEPTGRVE